MKKLLNVEQLFFLVEKTFKSKLKIIIEFGCTFGIVGKPLMSKSAPNWAHNVLTTNGEVIEY